MNPLKQVAVEHTETWAGVVSVEVENTKCFSALKNEPGQTGVFEVNSVSVFDGEEAARRFSYFNGKVFGPVRSTPAAAYDARFDKPTLVDAKIVQFRGLTG